MGPVKWPQTRRRDRAERYADSEATTRVSLVFLGLDPDLVAPSPSFPALVSLENSGERKKIRKEATEALFRIHPSRVSQPHGLLSLSLSACFSLAASRYYHPQQSRGTLKQGEVLVDIRISVTQFRRLNVEQRCLIESGGGTNLREI